ncbi:hypothetical protein BpHYR1_051041 [Brachionus plicatilis]|uniref:Uncharacterized protein n=1 Tax=Brachionus plicatilis TaxID=10195 RepID=A0A3M7SUF5_BRAPC|nr:hypothetical protein BpHYR1_051041 [Brachionus plicatilis]
MKKRKYVFSIQIAIQNIPVIHCIHSSIPYHKPYHFQTAFNTMPPLINYLLYFMLSDTKS